MDRADLRRRLEAALPPAAVQENAPLAPLTTFGVGGPAEWLLDVASPAQLCRVLELAREAGVPVIILGGGSNTIVSDEGLPGFVLRLRMTGVSQLTASVVRAEAGATINGLVRWTIGRGLAGLEAWAGTPGTVGGAVYGNAHYGGRNIGELIVDTLVCTSDGELRVVPHAEMRFGYDTSRLQTTHEILVWADFAVSIGDPEALRGTARASLAHRKKTQPLAQPSAGCLFQNPDPARDVLPEGVPASAGALIDRAGLKGHRIGGAMISPVHANFVVSDGHATAADIRALSELVKRTVRERFGVDLRNEVVFLGHF
jgi:UDP-N-acetylmuramate dehydrogenase